MLDYLRIQDLALIEDVSLDFAAGVNVLTGETGAGKSFILKAIDFITGEKLTPGLVRPGRDKASAEAVFSLPEGEELRIRRELAADTGRSRLFINDRLSSQESLRDLRPSLILHTSQQGQQKLLLPSFQNNLLDGFMRRPELLERRAGFMRGLEEAAARRSALEERSRALAGQREFLEFQLEEIRRVNPKPGEEEELEVQRQGLRLAAGRRESLERALSVLHGQGRGGRGALDSQGGLLEALNALEKALAALVQLAGPGQDFTSELEAVRTFYPQLAELSARLRGRGARSALGPGGEEGGGALDADAVEKRLFALAQLKRKLHRSLPELLALEAELAGNLDFLDNCALELKQLEREESALADELAALLAELNPARLEAAGRFKRELEAELRELGFSESVELEFSFTPRELFPGRADCLEEQARLLWKPNPGQPARPLEQIASGGELSRFLLALVSLSSRRLRDKPALLFDEVDSGVGGITLNKVADKLRRLGEERQIILITHWPALAAAASRHFQVRKEVREGETYTVCRRLSGEEVLEEIARMGGGGAQGLALARELRPTR